MDKYYFLSVPSSFKILLSGDMFITKTKLELYRSSDNAKIDERIFSENIKINEFDPNKIIRKINNMQYNYLKFEDDCSAKLFFQLLEAGDIDG